MLIHKTYSAEDEELRKQCMERLEKLRQWYAQAAEPFVKKLATIENRATISYITEPGDYPISPNDRHIFLPARD